MQKRERARPAATGPNPEFEYRHPQHIKNASPPQTVGSILTAVPVGTAWTIKFVTADGAHRLGVFKTRQAALRAASHLAEQAGAVVVA